MGVEWAAGGEQHVHVETLERSRTAAPGWYQDPWGHGMRWWDGATWTAQASGMSPAPVRPAAPAPLERPALPALVAGVVGLAPVAIVLGVMARLRIRRARGPREGAGLALGGILLGIG